jgi:hypothetical protein
VTVIEKLLAWFSWAESHCFTTLRPGFRHSNFARSNAEAVKPVLASGGPHVQVTSNWSGSPATRVALQAVSASVGSESLPARMAPMLIGEPVIAVLDSVPVQFVTFAVPVFRTTYSTRMLSAGIPLFAFQLAQKSVVPPSSIVTNPTSWKLPAGKFWAESQDTRLSDLDGAGLNLVAGRDVRVGARRIPERRVHRSAD